MYRYFIKNVIFILVLSVLLIPHLHAQDSLLMNYQGKLSNSGGTALTGNYDITFRIYSTPTGGTSLWNETHSSVMVSNGIFNINIGSKNLLANTILDGSDRYLGISIGADPELTPRSLLTSTPNAAVAGKVIGDIETGNRSMLIKTDNGDSSIVLIDRGYGPHIMMFDPQPEPPGKPLIDMSADGTFGPSIVMFDPQPEPPGKAFEVVALAGSGPSMSFFNQAGQVMGVEPSPFNSGYGWVMFDPQPEPPGRMFDITTSFGTTKSTNMRMYGAGIGGAYQEIFNLSAAGTSAEILMGVGTSLKSTASTINIKSDETESTIEITGPSGALAASPIILTSDLTDARIGIGTSAPSQALHVVGDICYTGSIGACSDESFKKDIQPIENALESVEQISGVTYSWRTEEFPERKFDSDRQVGLIAQQVKDILPEAVTLQNDGYYTIDYSRLTPLLLEAIKELKDQNDQLIKRLDALEKKNN